MVERSLAELGPLQRKVMGVVWDLGEATVHDVRERLARAKKEVVYTTVLSVMQKLEKLGWLTHETGTRPYVYRPMVTRRNAGVSVLREVTERVFGGDPLEAFQRLLDAKGLDDADLVRLKKMIDARRKELRDE